MATAVIKEVKALAGGIDQYLLTRKNEELLFPKAIQIKRNLRRLLRVKARDEATAAIAEGGSPPAVPLADLPYKVPKLWGNRASDLGFPHIYGSGWGNKGWEQRPYKGHMSRR